MMNVLLTCVGRRNYLVEFFREALGSRGHVFGADADAHASALAECDKAFIVRRVEEAGYCDELVTLCEQHDVGLMVPLLDLELPLVARARDRFLSVGTVPVISPPEVVDTCFDKWATVELLCGYGFRQPQTYRTLHDARAAIREGKLRYPVVVKPRWGSASVGIEYAADDAELGMCVRLLRRRLPRTILGQASMTDPQRAVLIQERLDGCEYGIDVVNDLNGRYVTTFIRQKLGMRAGETDQAMTVRCNELARLGKTIGEKLGHRGIVDCDVIVTTRGSYLLEMNPRFGGGYPFSHRAGANLPAMLVAWADGTPLNPTWMTVEPDVIASKCDRIVTARQHVCV